MSRLVQRDNDIIINIDQEGCPQVIERRGVRYRVAAILDRWYDAGCWWEGEPLKLFFRLQLEGLKVWEVYYEPASNTWKLYKIYD